MGDMGATSPPTNIWTRLCELGGHLDLFATLNEIAKVTYVVPHPSYSLAFTAALRMRVFSKRIRVGKR